MDYVTFLLYWNPAPRDQSTYEAPFPPEKSKPTKPYIYKCNVFNAFDRQYKRILKVSWIITNFIK